jgi:hypothetical protein
VSAYPIPATRRHPRHLTAFSSVVGPRPASLVGHRQAPRLTPLGIESG